LECSSILLVKIIINVWGLLILLVEKYEHLIINFELGFYLVTVGILVAHPREGSADIIDQVALVS